MDTGESPRFAEVAVDGTLPGGDSPTLTYRVPGSLARAVRPGALVWVPLRRKAALGIVVGLHGRTPEFELKEIFDVAPGDGLSAEQIDFGLWMQRETASSLFGCLELMLPPGVEHSATPWFELCSRAPGRTRTQERVLELLRVNGSMSLDQLQQAVGSSLSTVLPGLERAGRVSRRYQSDAHTTRQRTIRWWVASPDIDAASLTARQRELFEVVAAAGPSGIRANEAIDRTGVSTVVARKLVDTGTIAVEERPVGADGGVEPAGSLPSLNSEQQAAWAGIEAELRRATSRPQVIFGVTGSGKTELYLRAIAMTLRRGRQAIYLVPEIALTTQIAQRVKERFPGRVAILHSGLAIGARQEAWNQIASGERSIVVGARSALFAPAPELGLIVLDEEHDPSYKQDSDPRYNARTVAEEIARRHGAALVIGSATPRTETLWRANSGEYDLYRLRKRAVATAPDLPAVEIVDLRMELQSGHTSLISRSLQAAIHEALGRGEQTMLLLNRRGMATIVICRSCGIVRNCPNCSISLVYHEDRGILICHRCDHRERPKRDCPVCDGPLDYFGAGTQRVEAEIRRLFPDARIARWDQDVARRRGGNASILQMIERREVDIIIGTQLIAKGLDLPYVTTVGIVNADIGLRFPDFRSGERTFQLITQMAGRAGRRTPGSRVVVQTYSPDHYVLLAAATHDVEQFFRHEIQFREEYRYPPFVRMVRYLIRGGSDDECALDADSLVRALGRQARSAGVEIEIVGPAPAFIARIRGEQQWHVIVKARPDDIERMLDGLPHPPAWAVDVDPVSLL
jgi:primosomal protein N' (replication factor Y) (superfamily II helicase)